MATPIGRTHYNKQDRLRGIALAKTIGSNAAADELGINPRTVGNWMKHHRKGHPSYVPTSGEKMPTMGKPHSRLEAKPRAARQASSMGNGGTPPRDDWKLGFIEGFQAALAMNNGRHE